MYAYTALRSGDCRLLSTNLATSPPPSLSFLPSPNPVFCFCLPPASFLVLVTPEALHRLSPSITAFTSSHFSAITAFSSISLSPHHLITAFSFHHRLPCGEASSPSRSPVNPQTALYCPLSFARISPKENRSRRVVRCSDDHSSVHLESRAVPGSLACPRPSRTSPATSD
ncbi:hypothetical protein PDE_07185 [Penicillium oxalicum 114-2]|uniref:Uncharacterized protein n=1 Tax=Penicillium oxalicum (strain 114-2 / CGMCC 5302) TaxID=933388 RepID=S7ZNG6_PENO1|nr:hypothetical protein PDE_07185 [Penicillium oxalicum 114-2]